MSIVGRKTVAVSFVPILLVAAIFGVYVALATYGNSPYEPSAVSGGSGLELLVSLNSTNFRVGEVLNITISLFNPLSSLNQVSIPTHPKLGDFKVQGFPIAMWGACFFPEPVEFVIVKGNYSLGDLEQLSTNSSTPSIVCMEGGAVNQLVFQGNSDVANLTGNFCTASCNPYHMNSIRLESNFTVNGYWVYPLNSTEDQDIFTPYSGCISPQGNCGVTFGYPEAGPIAQSTFSPGLYTLVVADAWGQVHLLYFTVSN